MDTEPRQGSFEGWALLELMGHQREIGYVTTEAFGGAVLFRVEVPEIPERTIKNDGLERAFFPEFGYMDPCQSVTSPAVPPRTRMISPSALYAMNPCTQEAARKALEKMRPPFRLIGDTVVAAIEGPTSPLPQDEDGEYPF